MSITYDEKGKLFTEVISKDPRPALIQTLTHRIQGTIYVRRGERLIDELCCVQFIAVTDAVIYNAQGAPLYRSDFLTINREHVVWVLPQEEAPPDQSEVEGQQL